MTTDYAASSSSAELLGSLRDELMLAIRWNRPLIVFVVGGDSIRRRAQVELAGWLREQGQRVEALRVNTDTHVDVPLRLSQKRQSRSSVYFVKRLTEGGLAALNALNVRREYLVDRNLRVVFWLSEQEEASVARFAPDFWAFRHRVIYLSEY